MPLSLTLDPSTRNLILADDHRIHRLHPIWLRERTTEPGMVDEGNRQRLYDPADLPDDLRGVAIDRIGDGTTVRIAWSDGHAQNINLTDVARELGWLPDPETPPTSEPWSTEPVPFPRVPFPADGDDSGLHKALDLFWRLGFVVLGGTSTEPDALLHLATRFGSIRTTNFGTLFDVISAENPSDLAYTTMGLSAHSDNPYRRPVPGIQFLHSLRNDASGGDSTLVDGLAAAVELDDLDPIGYRALATTQVTFRYQFGADAYANSSPMIETDTEGRVIAVQNADRHDYVDAVRPERLTDFYRARRTFRQLVNDPSRQASFRLAEGDLLMMDNRRLLHGRTEYSLDAGGRHLQGCYVEHDGPDLAWRRLARSRRSSSV
ncbi:MAG: TauD/TfdA family dioxygenase [Acidimicrobiales bacterium]